jgi:hypothetical protein
MKTMTILVAIIAISFRVSDAKATCSYQCVDGQLLPLFSNVK